MTEPSERPTPPEGLPPKLVDALTGCEPTELRKAIVHAQELLHSHEEAALPVEAEAREDILRITERDGYTEVVKQYACREGCDDCPHGPYLYHVTEETLPDGTRETRWSFMGRVNTDGD